MKHQQDRAADSSDGAADEATGPGEAGFGLRVWARLSGTLGSLVFFLPLAFIFDLVGYIPPYLRLFAVYTLLALPLCRYARPALLRTAPVLLAVMVLHGVTPLPEVAGVLLLAFTHVWIWSHAHTVSRALLRGVAFYALLHVFLFASPLGYHVLEVGAGWMTQAGQRLARAEIKTGYTYQNLGSLLLFLSLSIHLWDRSRVSILRTGAFLVVAVLLSGFLSAALLLKVNLAPELAWELKFRDVLDYHALAEHLKNLPLLVFPAVVFLAYATAYLFLHHDVRPATADPAAGSGDDTPPPRRFAGLLYLALAAALLLLSVPPTLFPASTTTRPVFLHRGVVSFTKPEYGRYGQGAGGMYGYFPDYTGLFGCPGEVVRDIPDDLDADQVLVITNLDEPLTAEEHEHIWAFVRDGGKLWVLGDHTFIKNGRNHINDLLEPTHIRFANDSAQFWPQGWFNSYRMRQGTPFGALRDPAENRLSLLVGASLLLEPPARPFIIGRFGYGDLGPDEEDPDRGYLGDFTYQGEEQLGDLVLVAGEQVGEGKVVVFGDTTSFFNGNHSRSYELLRATLTWLGEPASRGRLLSRAAGGLALALALALLCVSAGLRPSRAPPAALCVFGLAALFLHQPSGLLPLDHDVSRERAALIDFSHQPYLSKHGSMDEGMYGLNLNLLRYGMMPVTQNTWNGDLVDAAAVVFLVTPQQPISAARQRALTAFMERGGAVILTCGYKHYSNCKDLLDALGLGIESTPLGRFFDRPAFGRPIQFFSAWPIRVDHPDASVICAYDQWPVIVDVPVGAGHLVLIGDSEFLHNKNLESLERYALPNIEFLRNLLDYTTGERTGGGSTEP